MIAGIQPFQQPPVPSHNTGVVPSVKNPRSMFDKSHRHLTTIDPGYLYPLVMDQVYPATTIEFKPTILGRIATLLKPLMHRGYFEWEAWFVPDRLCQKNFVKMMGEQDNPDDSIDFVRSKVSFSNAAAPELSIFDYAGIPTHVPLQSQLIAAPFLAYNLIYNNDYRDQNYQDSVYFNDGDGPHAYTNFSLKKRAKFHDRFTSVLPWQQKGTPVEFSFTGSAPVVFPNYPNSLDITSGSAQGNYLIRAEGDNGTTSTLSAGGVSGWNPSGPEDATAQIHMPSTAYADLTTASSFTINDWIFAYQSQQLLMIDAQRGTRYPEFIYGHWGVQSDDARLQRPEYLGGGTVDLIVGPVPTTSGSSGNVGDLAAYGVAHGTQGEFVNRSFTEYGWFIVLVSVHFDLLYQQGIDPKFTRDTKESMYLPILASIPEQPLLNQEVVYQNSPGTGPTQDQGTFGFTPAWEDLRVGKSIVTGAFRSNFSGGSLDVWHLAQDFRDPGTHNPALPVMGDDFIQENPPLGRVIAVPSSPGFVLDCWFDYKSTQEMPLYAWPGLSTHL